LSRRSTPEFAAADPAPRILRKRISERGVQFIGEETKHGEPSIAQEVCASDGCRYANIEMHPDERAEQKIPANYETDSKVSQEERTRFHQEREEYMFGKAVAEAAAAESIIVICGRYHAPALAKKFRGLDNR